MTDLTLLQAEFQAQAAEVRDAAELESLRINYLGRKGKIAALFREMGSLSETDRPKFGQALNQLKELIEDQIRQKEQSLGLKTAQGDVSFDPTLPGISPRIGKLHPITQTIQ